MSNRQKLIKGRSKIHIPNLGGAMIAVSRKASWPRILAILGVAAVIAIVLAVVVGKHFFAKPETPSVSGEVPYNGGPIRHPLTGEKLEAELEKEPQVFAVMVENSYEAWPLSGLNDAFLVIEAPVEGNIPRFETFFYEGQKVDKIGPVRSARPYYLDWADELNALYAHVGGSPEALDLISSNKTTRDLNEFYQGEYFWRDNIGRSAPHNAYTSTALLASALTEVGGGTAGYGTWNFKDDEPTTDKVASPTINWSDGAVYDVTWNYSGDTNAYERIQGNAVMHVSSGASVMANNVVIMQSDVSVVDDVGRRHVRTLGEGKAIVYQDGKRIDATWKKDSRTGRLTFFHALPEDLGLTGNGSVTTSDVDLPIDMNAGKTWIEVVPDLSKVSTN
jgi:hypothetical protein